jgi:hypothetical protein
MDAPGARLAPKSFPMGEGAWLTPGAKNALLGVLCGFLLSSLFSFGVRDNIPEPLEGHPFAVTLTTHEAIWIQLDKCVAHAKSETYHRAKKLPYAEYINTFRPEGFLPFPSASFPLLIVST